MSALPSEAAARVEYPMADGLLFYFPAALAGVARCSKIGNDQHNPGQAMHWAMDKSTDHANKILRHLLDVGTDDSDGIPHSVKVAWRALALAQEDLMARHGAPMPRNGRKSSGVSGLRLDGNGRRIFTQPPNCDGQEALLPLVRNADGSLSCSGTDDFARDDEATGL